MKRTEWTKVSQVGPRFEITVLEFTYEPDKDGTIQEFSDRVKLEFPEGTPIQFVKGGARVTFLKELPDDSSDENRAERRSSKKM